MPNPNLLAVLVAAFIPMVVGSLWYGPLFGKQWMRMVDKTEEELKEGFNPMKSYGVTFVMALLMAYVLAHILIAWEDAYGLVGLWAGIQGAFWIWLGFVLTIGWQAVAFEDKKLGLYWLNMLYNLVTLLAMGALLGVWR
ncbi:MAG: DUF1761 domain-containing protein [Rhodothermales bacterium]|nr:DUF1761 domain-containing protein [Rhodothermales bacterium]